MAAIVTLHIESPYNFGGTGPILGVKNPLQRVNGHAVLKYVFDNNFLFFVTVTATLDDSRRSSITILKEDHICILSIWFEYIILFQTMNDDPNCHQTWPLPLLKLEN
jgi:hypothetical protein